MKELQYFVGNKDRGRTMATLYYILDPMCSWCWGFRPVLAAVLRELPAGLSVRYVMGGLAPDSDETMSVAMRARLERAWRAVEARTGARFNHEFWTRCEPRRSTWPACRAVIAAGLQDAARAPEMIQSIQEAYYLQARNPSDTTTLVELAGEMALDVERFSIDLSSSRVAKLLQADFSLVQRFGIEGFPSLVLHDGERAWLVAQGYTEVAPIMGRLRAALSADRALSPVER